MKYFVAALFGAMCIAQWYVPASMIVEREDVLANGKVYRFKTAPIDPNDPFRGKYVILDFEAETVKGLESGAWPSKMEVFVIPGTDENGFAFVSDIRKTGPDSGEDFFKATVRYSNERLVELQFPFDRFYVEESKASAAETVYAESNRAGGGDERVAHAVVRVKDGKAALVDVRIDEVSIIDIVREMQQNSDSGGVEAEK